MVMKREVVGYTTMSEHLIDTQLTHSPFFFASANQSMLGCGVAHAFQQAIPFAELANQAKQLLQQAKRNECDNPLLFGIVPFDPKTPTRFMIPRTLYVSSSPRLNRPAHLTRQVAKLISSPSGEQYKQGVSHLLNMFHHSGLSKVVLSRAIEIATEQEIALPTLLRNLLAINHHGYTFAASLDEQRKLIGASPELLVAKRGNYLISNPLAGSRPRSQDAQENAQRRASLLNTAKDLHEHGLVVEEVERIMSRYCRNLCTPMVPSVIETETMLHLSTLLEGQVSDPEVCALQVAADLHPTPAVCGFPRESAYQAIRELEEFDRGYFTGMVGWCDARGNGEWVVTIRCAEVGSHQMKLFAGAGIVDESLPQSELEETGAKMKTILAAAGIELNDVLTA